MPNFAEPDVLRSVQLLPGVEARSDWSSGFNIRGGEGDQTQVLLDGFPIFNPFHVGGIFSSFIDGTIGNVELHTGALPARFGGRLSGVLDVQSANPTRTKLHGSANVSLVSASATLGKAFKNGSGGWQVGVRRTYVDALLEAVLPGEFPYHFEDVSAHISQSIGGGIKLSATAYSGREKLADGKPTTEQVGWNNQLVGLSLSRSFTTSRRWVGVRLDSTNIEQRVSSSRFQLYASGRGPGGTALNLARDTRSTTTLTIYQPKATTTVGFEVAAQRFRYHAKPHYAELADVIPIDSLGERTNSRALFANHEWRPHASLLLNLGARLEAVDADYGLGYSPRVSLKYFIAPTFALKAGAGRYTQWTHSLGHGEGPVQAIQFWALTDSAVGVSTAKDAVLGAEKWLSARSLLNIGAFYKTYDRLLDPNPFSHPDVPRDAFVQTEGESYGAELMLRRLDGGKFSGWFAYSWALNMRTDAAGLRYAPPQDRRHNFNVVGSWQLARYSLGARVHAASGSPITPDLGAFSRSRFDPITQRWVYDPTAVLTLRGARGSARLPGYQRIDVSASRTGRLFGLKTSSYLSVVNILNSPNPAGFIYSFDRGSTLAKRVSFPNMPVLPTFGVSIVY